MSNQFLLANYIPISKNQSLRNFFSPNFVLFSSCNTLCFTYLFNLHIGMRTKKKRCDYYLKIDLTYLTSQNYPPPPSNATILNKVVHSRIFSRQKKTPVKSTTTIHYHYLFVVVGNILYSSFSEILSKQTKVVLSCDKTLRKNLLYFKIMTTTTWTLYILLNNI